ncbi:hypothetical protein HanRHA438_Chr02g0081801 [Helianthus annuus]|nr:hypothetical protein HanRHA438_Chr02g0081801 [Helianthus annuus]
MHVLGTTLRNHARLALHRNVKEMAKTKEKPGSSSSSSRGKGKEKEQPSKKRQYLGRVSESEEEEEMQLDPSDKPVWNSGSLDDQPEIWQPTL